MKTDDLISLLSQDARPQKRQRIALGLAAVALVALCACVVCVAFVDGVRPDIEHRALPVALKATFSSIFAVGALLVAARLARPGQQIRVWGLATLLIALVTMLFAGFSLMPPGGERVDGMAGTMIPAAFLIIPALATPTAVVIFGWYRRHAPTRLRLAGATIGALSGGLGAMAYALVCPVDDMRFVAVWYGGAILFCLLLGALAGPRVLKW